MRKCTTHREASAALDLFSYGMGTTPIELKYETYSYTAEPGWSISRYEMFDTCKRRYFYTYYRRHVTDVPHYTIQKLREMTSVPLETGNVVHDVMEAFLRRLQKDDSAIDEEKLLAYSAEKTSEYFGRKTFMELYYGDRERIDMEAVHEKVRTCLANFLGSPTCNWIYMKALTNRDNWMIEPPGYGETRLDGIKAYCKMDFLFPVDDDVYILDWKTGRKDTFKHTRQLTGYAAAASNNFHIPWSRISPRIVYLYPAFEELEAVLKEEDIQSFLERVRAESEEMKSFCVDPQRNIPLPIDHFPPAPSPSICRNCVFRELCFPDLKGR